MEPRACKIGLIVLLGFSVMSIEARAAQVDLICTILSGDQNYSFKPGTTMEMAFDEQNNIVEWQGRRFRDGEKIDTGSGGLKKVQRVSVNDAIIQADERGLNEDGNLVITTSIKLHRDSGAFELSKISSSRQHDYVVTGECKLLSHSKRF